MHSNSISNYIFGQLRVTAEHLPTICYENKVLTDLKLLFDICRVPGQLLIDLKGSLVL